MSFCGTRQSPASNAPGSSVTLETRLVVAEEEPKYCPQCRAPWVWGNDFCVQCGHVLR